MSPHSVRPAISLCLGPSLASFSSPEPPCSPDAWEYLCCSYAGLPFSDCTPYHIKIGTGVVAVSVTGPHRRAQNLEKLRSSVAVRRCAERTANIAEWWRQGAGTLAAGK